MYYKLASLCRKLLARVLHMLNYKLSLLFEIRRLHYPCKKLYFTWYCLKQRKRCEELKICFTRTSYGTMLVKYSKWLPWNSIHWFNPHTFLQSLKKILINISFRHLPFFLGHNKYSGNRVELSEVHSGITKWLNTSNKPKWHLVKRKEFFPFGILCIGFPYLSGIQEHTERDVSHCTYWLIYLQGFSFCI